MGRPTTDLYRDKQTSNRPPMPAPEHLTPEQREHWDKLLRVNPHVNRPEHTELLMMFVTAYTRGSMCIPDC